MPKDTCESLYSGMSHTTPGGDDNLSYNADDGDNYNFYGDQWIHRNYWWSQDHFYCIGNSKYIGDNNNVWCCKNHDPVILDKSRVGYGYLPDMAKYKDIWDNGLGYNQTEKDAIFFYILQQILLNL
jgi:hypothetical protein